MKELADTFKAIDETIPVTINAKETLEACAKYVSDNYVSKEEVERDYVKKDFESELKVNAHYLELVKEISRLKEIENKYTLSKENAQGESKDVVRPNIPTRPVLFSGGYGQQRTCINCGKDIDAAYKKLKGEK